MNINYSWAEWVELEPAPLHQPYLLSKSFRYSSKTNILFLLNPVFSLRIFKFINTVCAKKNNHICRKNVSCKHRGFDSEVGAVSLLNAKSPASA